MEQIFEKNGLENVLGILPIFQVKDAEPAHHISIYFHRPGRFLFCLHTFLPLLSYWIYISY